MDSALADASVVPLQCKYEKELLEVAFKNVLFLIALKSHEGWENAPGCYGRSGR